MQKNIHYTGTVEAIAWGGKGIVRHEGRVVFVPKAILGQEIEYRPTKVKKAYVEAKLVQVLKRSEYELPADEMKYQAVSGAPYASVLYATQVQWKENLVADLFAKMSYFTPDQEPDKDDTREALTPISKAPEAVLSSPVTWEYRNKMEYSFGPTDEHKEGETWVHTGFGLGWKKRGSFFLVENLEKPSGLFVSAFENHLIAFCALCRESGLPVYNQRKNEGFWRGVSVRYSFAEQTFLVNVITHAGALPGFVKTFWAQALGGQLAGLLHTVDTTLNDSTKTYDERTILQGEDALYEHINGLRFRIATDSFFQTNPAAAELLYEKVAEYVAPKAGETVLDLCCGTGTIGQILASKHENVNVVGVDIVPSAVEDAKVNAKLNNISGVSFLCADLKKWITEMPERGDIIVLDPPRGGISPKVLKKLLQIPARRLVYVSCNPALLARDSIAIRHAGYSYKRHALVDQFPHTHHAEVVMEFIRNEV